MDGALRSFNELRRFSHRRELAHNHVFILAAVNSTFRSAVTEERLLPFTALSDRCVLRRLCRLACV